MVAAPKRPETIEHGGQQWVEISRAAKFTRVKAVLIEQHARDGQFALLERDDGMFIPLGAANRLKRETAAIRAIDRQTRSERMGLKGKTNPQPRVGPISAHREKQDPLPMSSGRAGRGWLGHGGGD